MMYSVKSMYVERYVSSISSTLVMVTWFCGWIHKRDAKGTQVITAVKKVSEASTD